ncbi:hypothetical protein SASPL_157215 [Salvia splendens]|uniref:Uncharacterized protein n=1 Tax=Salvia splendens TaxID=180675 RepID=A0A8X8VVC0_SALSN|nr:hypothetical protein SASPL_157215 [Salvia splendens]
MSSPPHRRNRQLAFSLPLPLFRGIRVQGKIDAHIVLVALFGDQIFLAIEFADLPSFDFAQLCVLVSWGIRLYASHWGFLLGIE